MKLLPFSRFIVKDKSMMPAFNSGDHVLTFNWVRVKAGDVIVLNYGGKNYLKRVDKSSGENISVSGDNKSLSMKSILIKKEQITGRVLVKY